MGQENIIINDVEIPVIRDGNKIYYPISFMGKKLLFKNLSSNQLIKNGYGEYIKQFDIDFGKNTGSVQYTYCIDEDGFKKILKNSNINRLDIKQRKSMKKICKYFEVNIKIDLLENMLDEFDDWQEYDFWSKECICEYLKYYPNIKWQRCTNCNNYYPYDECFFAKENNPKNKAELKTKCKCCDNGFKMKYYNNELYTNTYYKDGIEWYLYVKQNAVDIYSIYEYYKNNDIQYPSILKNNISAGNIITKFYKDDILNNLDNCNLRYISKISKIPVEYISLKIIDKNIIKSVNKKELIHKINVNNRLEEVNLKRVAKNLKELSFEEAVEILNDYLINNNIKINNIYDYDYYKLVMKTKLRYFFDNNEMDVLEFIVKYYNYEYAPYKFKTRGTKFWKKRDNVDFTLRYLIEKDMKLQIEKIPLYITRFSLQQKSRTLYNILYEKRFDNTLFEWINRLYPDKFIEEDFNISVTRNQFDSVEERQIHDLLKQKFKNVIYNNKSNESSVNILGMMPDWFIFTDTNLYIIEYFGMIVNKKTNSKRLIDYKEKTDNKLEKYKKLSYGIMVYLYPDDLKNNFEGFYKKASKIV